QTIIIQRINETQLFAGGINVISPLWETITGSFVQPPVPASPPPGVSFCDYWQPLLTGPAISFVDLNGVQHEAQVSKYNPETKHMGHEGVSLHIVLISKAGVNSKPENVGNLVCKKDGSLWYIGFGPELQGESVGLKDGQWIFPHGGNEKEN